MVAANQASRQHGGSLELLTVEDDDARLRAPRELRSRSMDILIVELDDTIIGYARDRVGAS